MRRHGGASAALDWMESEIDYLLLLVISLKLNFSIWETGELPLSRGF